MRRIDTDRPPQRFGAFREGERIGVISAAAHADVAAVIDSGVEFRANVVEGTLAFSLTGDSTAAN
jgi:hypothetical protein